MSRSQTMYLDTRDLTRRLMLLNTKILPLKIKKGLAAAGNRLMMDTIVKEPTVPIKRPNYGVEWSGAIGTMSDRKPGELRASGALFVDGQKKRTSVHYGELATGKYQPTIYGGTPITPVTHEACIVFNAPYAAEQHNEWPDKTQPGAGRFYMSEKLYGSSAVYIALIARNIKL